MIWTTASWKMYVLVSCFFCLLLSSNCILSCTVQLDGMLHKNHHLKEVTLYANDKMTNAAKMDTIHQTLAVCSDDVPYYPGTPQHSRVCYVLYHRAVSKRLTKRLSFFHIAGTQVQPLCYLQSPIPPAHLCVQPRLCRLWRNMHATQQ